MVKYIDQSLWSDECVTKCIIYNLCHGSPSAPCKCLNPHIQNQRKCSDCQYICRERIIEDEETGLVIDFASYVRDGLPLEKLEINQIDLGQPPFLISTNTNRLPVGSKVPLNYVGIDIKEIFHGRNGSSVLDRPIFETEKALRKYLRINDAPTIMAILNGKDDILENFWAMGKLNRLKLYKLFEKAGIKFATCPTFSIIDETLGFPASHNVCMLLRHNRVADEMQQAEFNVVPNIYWRNESDILKWIDWISHQDKLYYISRDFSRTKKGAPFKKQFSDFIKIIEEANKKLHVFIIGVGCVKAAAVTMNIENAGCTCSIVTPDPVMEGIGKGAELKLNSNGDVSFSKNWDFNKDELAMKNILTLNNHIDKYCAKNRQAKFKSNKAV